MSTLDLRIYAAKVTPDLTASAMEKFYSFLKPKRQAKFQRFFKPEDKQRLFLADFLLYRVAFELLHLPPHALHFDVNPYGKPYFIGHDTFHFNISHSGHWIVCAVDCQPIGIDIEKIRPVDLRIAQAFFSVSECQDLMIKKSSEQFSYFFTLWTLKESYIKAVGRGLSIPLNSFSFEVTPPDDSSSKIRLKTTPSGADSSSDWFFQLYGIDPRYQLAVCARHPDFPSSVIIKSWRECIRDVQHW